MPFGLIWLAKSEDASKNPPMKRRQLYNYQLNAENCIELRNYF